MALDIAGIPFIPPLARLRPDEVDFGFHREGDPLAREIHFLNRDLNALADFNDIGGIFDKLIRELADVDEPVLVHADVHKGSEGGDVGDDAGEFHAGFELFHFFHALRELEDLEFLPRIASGFGEFLQNICECGKPDLPGDILFRVDFCPQRVVAKKVRNRTAEVFRHRVHQRIALGVNGTGIQRI